MTSQVLALHSLLCMSAHVREKERSCLTQVQQNLFQLCYISAWFSSYSYGERGSTSSTSHVFFKAVYRSNTQSVQATVVEFAPVITNVQVCDVKIQTTLLVDR